VENAAGTGTGGGEAEAAARPPAAAAPATTPGDTGAAGGGPDIGAADTGEPTGGADTGVLGPRNGLLGVAAGEIGAFGHSGTGAGGKPPGGVCGGAKPGARGPAGPRIARRLPSATTSSGWSMSVGATPIRWCSSVLATCSR
jgi:hypothetical protein